MMKTSPAFEDGYQSLNKAQKKAVDAVEGPVMVVAGPGTGKTHILTLRIANILRVTQAKPDAILALTFTDSAARTMRHRLAAVVGEQTARKVTITTFHGFAEFVRKEYPESFSSSAPKRLMGDVEEKLLMRMAIDTADIDLLRPAKAPYTNLNDLSFLYSNLSREGISFAEYCAWGKEEAKRLAADPTLQYKRGEKLGQLTKAGEGKVARFEKVEEAARVFERFDELKHERNLENFSDLLSGAITTIAKDETLRSDLQERYQYILADEHQDANALQHKLLELFAYDDMPNLFVVGDEKQAIYRFQGADLGAFESFTDMFPKAEVVTLIDSFRSYQHILDTSHMVVADTGTHAKLSAIRGDEGERVSRIVADDPLDERARTVSLVGDLLKNGVEPHEIAIITRKNETAALYSGALGASGIPFIRAGDISLTGAPIMRAVVALLSYVADPTSIGNLREALLAPWWGIPIEDVLILLRTSNDRELVQRLGDKFPKVSETLSECLEKSLVQSPAECFSFVFSTSGARDYFLSHAEHLDDIKLVRKLMMHFEEAVLLSETATFADSMKALNLAREHGLSPVKVSVTERKGHVTVITAHKSKGMEFRYVIVPDCTEQTWEKGGKPPLIPSPFDNKQSLDDSRRLFYVALTRGKDHVYISYAKENAEGRERMPTTLMPEGLSETVIASESLPVLHTHIEPGEKIHELIERYLTHQTLSPSAVNEYLESPATFFARRVLRIKEAPVAALIYGSAVHAAFATLLMEQSVEASHKALDRVFDHSLMQRNAIFEKLRKDAHAAFESCTGNIEKLGVPKHVEASFSFTHQIDGVPVTIGGKMDAAFETESGFYIADFKTGSAVSAKNEAYARQLALYADLLEKNDQKVDGALLLGVSEDGLKHVPVSVGAPEREKALADVNSMVRELRTNKWRKGERSEYDAILELLK